jgi:hypothetical protein
MNQKLVRHMFKTDINSVYQRFWFMLDILEISPNTEVHFDTTGLCTIMSITCCDLSYFKIQSILIEHTVEFERISY